MLDKALWMISFSAPACKAELNQFYYQRIMANTKQALKRVRQNDKRNAINTSLKSRVKTLRKNSLAAAVEGNKDAATKAFVQFSSAVDICAKKSIFHKNKAANLKSKTAKAIKAAQAA